MGAEGESDAAQRETIMLVWRELGRVAELQHARQGVIVLVNSAAVGSPACCKT